MGQKQENQREIEKALKAEFKKTGVQATDRTVRRIAKKVQQEGQKQAKRSK